MCSDEEWGWVDGLDYLSIDGSVQSGKRDAVQTAFNNRANLRARCVTFLIYIQWTVERLVIMPFLLSQTNLPFQTDAHIDPCRFSGYQYGGSQSSNYLRCLLESLSRHSIPLPCLSIRTDQTSLHLQIHRPGTVEYCNCWSIDRLPTRHLYPWGFSSGGGRGGDFFPIFHLLGSRCSLSIDSSVFVDCSEEISSLFRLQSGNCSEESTSCLDLKGRLR